MRFGIHVGSLGGTVDEIRRLWRLAEAGGFDWFSVSDHFQESPPREGDGACHEAISVLAAAAIDTTRVRVGCHMFSVGYRHPGLLAKSITTIDHLSGGRVECGLGAGWHAAEFAAFGMEFPSIATRQDQLEEYVQVVRLLLSQSRSDFTGSHYSLHDAPNYPRPVQNRIPLWIGGLGERRTLRTAAAYADAWNAAYLSPGDWTRKNEILNEWCVRLGRPTRDVLRSATVGFYMGVDRDGSARQEARWKQDWGSDQRGFTGFVRRGPDEVIETVRAYADAGAEHLNIAVRQGPYEWDALEAFVDRVIPEFR